MQGSATNRMGKRVMTIVGIALISFALLEVALRITGFYATYTEKMDKRFISFYNDTLPTWYFGHVPYDSLLDFKPEYHYRGRANNMGFRDKDFDSTEDSHVTKILAMGDSFTYGLGSSEDSTWPHLLEMDLNSNDSCKYRVYNCGIPGSDPFYEFVMVRDKLIKLKPDMVIMSCNYSDIHDYITRGGMGRFRPNGTTIYRKGPWFEPLYKDFHSLRLLLHFVLRYDYSLLSPSDHRMMLAQALDSIEACAASTQAFCDTHQIKFVFVIHPYVDPYDRYLKKQVKLPEMEEPLKKKGVAVVNLFGDFASLVTEANYKTYSWPKDMHFTPMGYDRFAHFLSDKLRKEYPDLLHAKCTRAQASID